MIVVADIYLTHSPIYIFLELGASGFHELQEVHITHLLHPQVDLIVNRELPLEGELHVGVGEADSKLLGEDALKVTEKQISLTRACKSFVYVIDRVVIFEDKFLLVDFDGSFEVDAVVEEFHERLNV